MLYTPKLKPVSVNLSDIAQGECFRIGDGLFIRGTDSRRLGAVRCTTLGRGLQCVKARDTQVVPVAVSLDIA